MNIFLDIVNFDNYIYYIQKYFITVMSLQINTFNLVTSFILFIAGIITSLNPCLLSIIPLSLSYLSLVSTTSNNKLYFFSGLSTSFLVFFVFSLTLNHQYISLLHFFPILSSVGFIFIGLNLLQIITLSSSFLNINKFSLKHISTRMKAYTIGIILGSSSFPCSISVLVTASLTLSYIYSYSLSIIYIFIYLSGTLISLFILINLAVLYTKLPKIVYLFNNISLVSGCFFVGIGIFSLLNTIFI